MKLLKLELKSLIKVKSGLISGYSPEEYIHLPAKWNFSFLFKEFKPLDGTFKYTSYEPSGNLSLLVRKDTIFFDFEAVRFYLDYYYSQNQFGHPDQAMLQKSYRDHL